MYTTPISKESIVLPQVEPGEHMESSKALGLRLKAHYDHRRGRPHHKGKNMSVTTTPDVVLHVLVLGLGLLEF